MADEMGAVAHAATIGITVCVVAVLMGGHWLLGRGARRPRRLLFSRQPLPAINACADAQADKLRSCEKLVWHFRHGESTANRAEKEAIKADTERGDGKDIERRKQEEDGEYADAPLTESGIQQAEERRVDVAGNNRICKKN